MSPNITNDLLYVMSITESIEKLISYSKEYHDPESFFEAYDQMPFNASLSLLVNIGEASSKVSSELRNKYKNIPWQVMKDFRNRVAHDYVNLNIFIVFDVIKNKLPGLTNLLEKIIYTEINDGNFVLDEYKACIGNRFYKHIDFNKINANIKNL